MLKGIVASVATVLLWICIIGTSNASLVTNGTFDTGLSDWLINSGETTWDVGSKTAHLGRSGTNMYSDLYQTIDTHGASAILIEFDYQWQINVPVSVDTFTFEIFEDDSDTATYTFTEYSSDGIFGTTITKSLTFEPLSETTEITLVFGLDETNLTNGTRIQLDNVSASPVPVPGAVILLGSGLVGLVGFRRRIQN